MATCLVRKLGCNDFGDAFELYKELAGAIEVLNDEQGLAQFEAILAHPGTFVIGAEVDGRIVSIATLHLLPNITRGGRPYALIENVVTLQGYRGQGFATKVMQAAADEAWAATAYKIMLLTGKALGARDFYLKLGYRDDQKYGMVLRRPPWRQPIVDA